jgi:predicted GIY-YIG superfamily endonuclease
VFYVYRIHSLKYPERNYVGYSADLKQRIADHNAGKNRFTSAFRPWKLVFYATFEKEENAREFESYLKTASGRAFGSKRLW